MGLAYTELKNESWRNAMEILVLETLPSHGEVIPSVVRAFDGILSTFSQKSKIDILVNSALLEMGLAEIINKPINADLQLFALSPQLTLQSHISISSPDLIWINSASTNLLNELNIDEWSSDNLQKMNNVKSIFLVIHSSAYWENYLTAKSLLLSEFPNLSIVPVFLGEHVASYFLSRHKRFCIDHLSDMFVFHANYDVQVNGKELIVSRKKPELPSICIQGNITQKRRCLDIDYLGWLCSMGFHIKVVGRSLREDSARIIHHCHEKIGEEKISFYTRTGVGLRYCELFEVIKSSDYLLPSISSIDYFSGKITSTVNISQATNIPIILAANSPSNLDNFLGCVYGMPYVDYELLKDSDSTYLLSIYQDLKMYKTLKQQANERHLEKIISRFK